MAEYIEREVTCGDCVHSEICEHFPTLTGWDALNPTYCSAFRNAADLVERKRGEWVASGPLLECQSCGEIYSRLGGNAGKAWNFCPRCGADMRPEGGAE